MGTTTFTGPVVSVNGFQGSLTLADPLATSAIQAADATSALTFANSTAGAPSETRAAGRLDELRR